KTPLDAEQALLESAEFPKSAPATAFRALSLGRGINRLRERADQVFEVLQPALVRDDRGDRARELRVVRRAETVTVVFEEDQRRFKRGTLVSLFERMVARY